MLQVEAGPQLWRLLEHAAPARLGDAQVVLDPLAVAEEQRFIDREVPGDAPLVVAGDFNDWRRKAHEILEREVGLCEVFVTAYGQAAKTFPAIFPILSLDRIYVRNASVHLPVVLPRKPWSHLSDHAPLVAEIHL